MKNNLLHVQTLPLTRRFSGISAEVNPDLSILSSPSHQVFGCCLDFPGTSVKVNYNSPFFIRRRNMQDLQRLTEPIISSCNECKYKTKKTIIARQLNKKNHTMSDYYHETFRIISDSGISSCSRPLS